MRTRKLIGSETPWIAEDARYVYTDDEQTVHHAALTYSQVHRRMLDRIEDDMMRALVDYDGGCLEILAQAWGALASVVHRMDWLTWLIVNTEGNAFDFELRDDGKLIRVEEHALGRYYACIRPLVFAIFDDELNLGRFKLPPYAELFRDVVAFHIGRIPLLYECFSKLPTYFDTNAFRFCGELANELLVSLRREAKVRRVNDQVAARKADGKRRMGRMQKFKNKCFEQCPELHVMQLECVYRPPERQDGRVTVPLDDAKSDHARFVNRLRGNTNLAAVAIGGIWSLAWGEYKGHHFRWIFMFNASLVADSTEWKELVASVWKSVVGDRAAYVGLVNNSPSLAAGLIRIDDAERMKLLDDELEYHAQKDNFILLKEAEDARSWGTWVPANTREDRRRNKPKESGDA